MSACPTQSFNNVSQDVFNCLVNKAASYGITISGNSGQGTKDGFTVTWNYDPAAETLQLQCTDSPWWAPCGTINSTIEGVVEGCM